LYVYHVQEAASEHSFVGQLNHAVTMTDIDETEVSLPRDEALMSADVDSQCLDMSSQLSDDHVAEAAAEKKPVVSSDAVDSFVDGVAGVTVSETRGAVCLPNSALDPQIMAVVDSVEKSLAAGCHNNTANSSDKLPSQHETEMAPTSVELQRKIIRQMEVCVYINSTNSGLLDEVCSFANCISRRIF